MLDLFQEDRGYLYIVKTKYFVCYTNMTVQRDLGTSWNGLVVGTILLERCCVFLLFILSMLHTFHLHISVNDTGDSGHESMAEPIINNREDGDFTKMSVPDMMKLYYGWLFPHDVMYSWLVYGNDSKHPQADMSYFQKREFCFTLDGDVFVRYQSFKNGDELQNAIKTRCPAKIDIGPVYNVDPQKRAAYMSGFAPQERELVFDIDLTDYDDVRTCGKEAHICNKCWPLMGAAIQILDKALREDFGFKHVFFVFSGRRGVHAWVCDEKARQLSDEARSAIANYLSVYKGQEKGVPKLSTGLESHPFISKAYDILLKTFETTLLSNQRLLEDEEQTKNILNMLPQVVREAVLVDWKRIDKEDVEEESCLSLRRWESIKECTKKECSKQLKSNPKDARSVKLTEKAVKDVVFAYAYPRLDIEVSKKMNHLLKAPFCVHPKTGKVCVPIDPKHAWTFDPDTVCTVGQLLNELNQNNNQGGDKVTYMETGMGKAVNTFRHCFLDSLMKDNKNVLAEKARQSSARHEENLAW